VFSTPPVGLEPRQTRNTPSKLAGVDAEVKKEGSKDVWYIKVATDMLAAGHERLSNAISR